MTIRKLPDAVSSAIAAGEVVERPASVVKELLENAIDANASSIEIHIREGGKGFIEVVDDGNGIAADEITLAVSRFTTSKLSGLDDLFNLRTLGFRGEALASIGTVAKMEIVSRSAEEDVGVQLNIAAGRVAVPQKTGAPQGTQVRVSELFHNVPARRKFLKTESTERRWITRLVTRYALAYPAVRFRYTSNGREAFHSSGNGDRMEVLAAIYGVDLARQFIQIPDARHGSYSISGCVGIPTVNRSNRGEITIFVNGRWIQDIGLTSAVVQAYHALMMVGRYPIAALFVQVPPSELDVNVHPAKAEVRFRKPDMLFSLVQRAVRATLLTRWSGPALSIQTPWAAIDSRPSQGEQAFGWLPAGEQQRPGREISLADQQLLPSASVPLLRAVGQVGACYLVAEGPEGIYLIDQHAAHERVLFERLMRQAEQGQLESQALLDGVTVELPPQQASLLADQLKALHSLGFDIEPFGSNTYRVRAIPAMLTGLSPDRAVWVVVEDFEEDEAPLAGLVEEKLAARVCKAAAIKAGQVLSLAEQEQLLRDLERCDVPRTCPHGRPTMIHLSVASLERQFGRRG